MENPRLRIKDLCELFGNSKQAYYKGFSYDYKEAAEESVVLAIVSDMRDQCPGIGTRKLQHLLAEHCGIRYGRDRLFDLLKREKLLLRQRHRKPRTTWSGHVFPVYPNKIKGIIPVRANEVWVSDITYIRVDGEFLYLFLITDMYSRKIVGWELASDMESRHAVRALEQAIAQKGESDQPTIHHSDRGSQYCCKAYVSKLTEAKIIISMTEKGDPKENAHAERINGTIKNEFLKALKPTSQTARVIVEEAIYRYNCLRPHASVGYLTPDEAHTRSGPLCRKWKTYPWYSKKRQEKSDNFALQPLPVEGSAI